MEVEQEGYDKETETSSGSIDAETAELAAEISDPDGFTQVQQLSEQDETSESPAAPAVSGEGQLKILIVEDDAHASEILETALDVAGYTADTIDAGEEAYSMIIESIKNSDPYDLVICDVMIPGINGLDLMIKVNETRSGIDFILVSAYEDENLSLQKQAEEEGALTFFSKPYDYKELIAFISKYAQSKMK
jgi:CheY-like chemotaxis protein